jgi:hypothetical protein
VAAVNAGGTSALSGEASATPHSSAATNVTSQVRVSVSGFVYNRRTGRYHSTVSIYNQSQQTVAGPVQLVVEDLPSGATLYNRSGITGGNPYVTVDGVSSIRAGQWAQVRIEVQAPASAHISFTPAVYSGTF